MKLNVLEKRICLPRPKESRLNKESNEIVGTGSKEYKEYHRDIINENKVTDRVNENKVTDRVNESEVTDRANENEVTDRVNENEATHRVNAIVNDSSKSEESFFEDFRTFKKTFLAEVNVFKKQLLTSNTKDNVNKSTNSDRVIILLEENIAFLKEQINKKDKVVDSLSALKAK